ncbi:Ig-like domain-containing protein [Lysinibacter cavernae]|uniref:Gram-positive cocci surface proteins LPxTG domain-containing protein n=1 Tax=Lysinibacter cavernae TaxID=1640652 RepID=A0A7X5R2K9_9MICO|nr:Ig-like domain-containing protein [Lysinibacter cavernae]NIH54525.1 hypothetical protein [Lysinibacter cavernae]
MHTQSPQPPDGRNRVTRAASRVLAIATAGLLTVSGLSLGAAPAGAFQGNSTVTASGSNASMTFPGGLTMTANLTPGTQGSASMASFVMAAANVESVPFSPADVVTGKNNIRISAVMSPPVPGEYRNFGAVTLSFSKPVTNPRLHLSRMFGGLVTPGADTLVDSTRVTVVDGTPSIPTLNKLSGFDGWTVTDSSVFSNTTGIAYVQPDACKTVAGSGLSPAGCGSVELTGTVQTVTLKLDTFQTVVGAGSTGVTIPYVNFEVTVDEDLAGGNTATPVSYGNASHVNSGLSIGAGLTNDATSTRTATTPQAQTTDVNDAFAENPTLFTGKANTIDVPVNGLLAGHTAVTSVWLDSNRNGVFDASEKYSAAAAGNGIHSVTLPSTATTTIGNTWMRIRTAETAVANATGFADSGEVEDWPVTVTAVPPAAPVVTSPADGALLNTATPTFTGTGEKLGQKIEVRDALGAVVCTTTVQAGLAWSCTPAVALPQGEANYSVYEIEPNNVASDPGTTLTLTIDSIAPGTPTAAPSNGKVVRGTAEPLSTVTITNAIGTVIGTGTADVDGNFVITTTGPSPATGDVLKVTATDAAGNVSPAKSVTVNADVPATPTVNASRGDALKGTGTAGETITASLPDGTKLTALVDGLGNWSIPVPVEKTLAHNDVVTVISTNPEGTPSLPASVTIDREAPSTPIVNPTNGSIVAGKAEPGATVEIRDSGNNLLATVTADPQGNYSKVFNPVLAHGLELVVTATDAAGNTSPAATTTVNGDPVAAPVINPTNGSTISGTGTAGTTITVTLPTGDPLTTTVNAAGEWSLSVPAGQALNHNDVVTATASNKEGTVSAPASQIVDQQAPEAPHVDRSNGVTITGGPVAAEDDILVLDANGDPIDGVLIRNAEDGTFVFTPTDPLAETDEVTVALRDPSGNTSDATPVVIDTSAPEVLNLNPSNGSVVRGTTEPFATVTIHNDENGTVLTVTADEHGDFVANFVPALTNGTVISVTAADKVGNTTAPQTVTVNTSVPTTPAINPSNGQTVSGIGDHGDTVTVTLPNGTQLTAIVNDQGTWSVDVPEADRPLNGQTILATAVNRYNTSSEEATRVVDTVAPPAPVVNPTNGTSVSGTSEPGATIIIRDTDGVIIGTGTADDTGAYRILFTEPLDDSLELFVSARDAAGNESPRTPAIVNAQPVDAPEVLPSNGNVVRGTGTPGHDILVTLPNGEKLATTVDDEGNWAVPVSPRLANGDVVTATATNPEGTISEPGSVTVDTIAPLAPVLKPSDGVTITGGTVEQGDTVTVLGQDDLPIAGTITVNGDGTFVFTPSTPLTAGAIANVVVTDPSGNASNPVAAEIITAKPATPAVEISNGTSINGGPIGDRETVAILDGAGEPLEGDLTMNEDGTFVFVPKKPLTDDDIVTIVVTGPSGLESAPAQVEIVSIAPKAPAVEVSDGATISGGPIGDRETVAILDGSGEPIEGDLVMNPDGTFEFTPKNPLGKDDIVTVVVTGPSGLKSAPKPVEIITDAPATPPVDVSDGTAITGGPVGERDTITVLDGHGEPIEGTLTVGGDGMFVFVPKTPLTDDDVVNIIVTGPSGLVSNPAEVDIVATKPATPAVDASNGKQITGGPIGDRETVAILDGNGEPLEGDLTMNEDGTFVFIPKTPLTEKDTAKVVVTGPSGLTSTPEQVTIDTIAPSVPKTDVSDGTVITGGPVEDNVTISFVDKNGNAIEGTVTIDSEGMFSFVPTDPIDETDGAKIVVTDAVGNASTPSPLDVVTTVPSAPHVNVSNGTQITGGPIGERDTIAILDGNGDPIEGDLTVDEKGMFVFVPMTPLTDTDIVNVVVTGPSGLTSPPSSVTVDTVAPDAPVVQPSNGSVVRGTAEAGSKVTIRDADGNVLGTTLADDEGNFSLAFSPAIADKTTLFVTATDAAGNTSPQAESVVNGAAVLPPYVAPTQGGVLTGTGMPCDTITITLPDGTVLTTVVGDNGTWSIDLAPNHILTNGDVLRVTATNAAGTKSEPTAVIVDQLAPEQPAVDPSTGNVITGGPVDKGDTVTFVDGDGKVISGEVVIDENGMFTFIPTTPLSQGAEVFVVVTDASGNSSVPLKVTISAPATRPDTNNSGQDSDEKPKQSDNGSAGLSNTGDNTLMPLGSTALLVLLAGAGLIAMRKRRDA